MKEQTLQLQAQDWIEVGDVASEGISILNIQSASLLQSLQCRRSWQLCQEGRVRAKVGENGRSAQSLAISTSQPGRKLAKRKEKEGYSQKTSDDENLIQSWDLTYIL